MNEQNNTYQATDQAEPVVKANLMDIYNKVRDANDVAGSDAQADADADGTKGGARRKSRKSRKSRKTRKGKKSRRTRKSRKGRKSRRR
jgi:hypothetical protein